MFSVLQSLLTGYKKVLLKGFGAYTTQFKDVLVEVNLANYSIISMACSMICWHIQFLFSLVCHLLRSSEMCTDQWKLGFPFGHTVPCSYTYTSSEGVVKKHISALKNCGWHTLQILECIDSWVDLYSEARSWAFSNWENKITRFFIPLCLDSTALLCFIQWRKKEISIH